MQELNSPISPAKRIQMEDKFYSLLEEQTTLADYFCVLGPDENQITEILQQNATRDQLVKDLQQIKPEVLSIYPDSDKKGLPLDLAAINQLTQVWYLYF